VPFGLEGGPGEANCLFNTGNFSILYTTAPAKMIKITIIMNKTQRHFLEVFGFGVFGFSSVTFVSGMFSGTDSDSCCREALARISVAGGDFSGLNLNERIFNKLKLVVC
jgi:hypothetical protein